MLQFDMEARALVTKRAADLKEGDRIVTTLWQNGQEVEDVDFRDSRVRIHFVGFGGMSCYFRDENVIVIAR